MNEEEKKVINIFIEKCNKYDESVEIKGISVGEEYRMLDTVCKALNLIEKLQKENEELKIKNNAIKRESEAYAEQMIRLDIEKQDYFEKYRYHLQQNESLTKEFSNVISVQKVKDKIRHYQELQDNYIKKYDEINEGLQAMINVLQELIEEREEK